MATQNFGLINYMMGIIGRNRLVDSVHYPKGFGAKVRARYRLKPNVSNKFPWEIPHNGTAFVYPQNKKRRSPEVIERNTQLREQGVL